MMMTLRLVRPSISYFCLPYNYQRSPIPANSYIPTPTILFIFESTCSKCCVAEESSVRVRSHQGKFGSKNRRVGRGKYGRRREIWEEEGSDLHSLPPSPKLLHKHPPHQFLFLVFLLLLLLILVVPVKERRELVGRRYQGISDGPIIILLCLKQIFAAHCSLYYTDASYLYLQYLLHPNPYLQPLTYEPCHQQAVVVVRREQLIFVSKTLFTLYVFQWKG